MDLKLNAMYDRTIDLSVVKNKILDIKYGPYERNLLDIYYPDDFKGNLPLILFITGGGFTRSSKRHFQLAPSLIGITKGYAVASIAYRVLPDDVYPSALFDAKAALRYLKAHSKELHIDKDRVVVWGESAGGVLATRLGYTEGIEEFEDLSMGNPNEDTKVKAVINWYGPVTVDLMRKSKLENPNIVAGTEYDEKFMYGVKTEEELTKLLNHIYPVNFAKKDGPKLFLLQGKKDQYVDWHCAQALYDDMSKILDASKHEIELVYDENSGHGVEPYYNTKYQDMTYEFIERWI